MFLDDLDDLDGILQRHRAFWQREIVDRPPVAVTAPIDRPAPLPPYNTLYRLGAKRHSSFWGNWASMSLARGGNFDRQTLSVGVGRGQ